MNDRTYKIVLASALIGLGVAIAPFLYIPFLTTKAYPGQHIINSIAGIMLGPWWAALIAIAIGIIRNMLGVGTIYAFPGGIPGGIVVGVTAWLLRKLNVKQVEYAVFTEPIGTAIIGGTLSVYIVAPIIGDPKVSGALLPIWALFGLSSIIGCIIAFAILKVLSIAGFSRLYRR